MKTFFFALLVLCATTLKADDDWFSDVGFGYSAVNYPINDDENITQLRPTFNIGFTKILDDSWQLRSAIDMLYAPGNDSALRGNLMNWRMAEVNYRLADDWAITAYLGLARYYRDHPAFGHSQGLGLKFRSSSRWFISSELQTTNVDISNSVPSAPEISSATRFFWISITLQYAF